jgi:hypothetical protein
MSDTRERIHELIDWLPPTQLSAVAGLLEAILNPAAVAAVDDEPVTDEDCRRLREGQASFAERGGKLALGLYTKPETPEMVRATTLLVSATL